VDITSLLPVLGILALAVAVVVLLLRFMRARHVAYDRRAASAAKAEAPPHASLSKDEQELLDSSHIGGPIVPGGRDALETWQTNRRK
jgi:hypothetical protein